MAVNSAHAPGGGVLIHAGERFVGLLTLNQRRDRAVCRCMLIDIGRGELFGEHFPLLGMGRDVLRPFRTVFVGSSADVVKTFGRCIA